MASKASSACTTGSESARTVSSARSRARGAFSLTRKPQAKSEPCRSPPKEMGVATISSPMWQGPSSSVPERSRVTAFSMLWLQRRRPSLSARQEVQIRFCGGMMMPLPWSSNLPRGSVKDSSMPHQRRTVSRILRTIWSSSSRVESMGIGSTELLLQRGGAEVGHLGDGPRPVHRDHRGERAHQPRILALDGGELLRRLVAFQPRPAVAHALQRDGGGHVEEEREIGPPREAVRL